MRDTATGIGKPATRYTVKDAETGEPVFFFGTYQLDSKLRVSDVGHYVNITCEGADQAAGRNGNAMKLFKVLISKETAPGGRTMARRSPITIFHRRLVSEHGSRVERWRVRPAQTTERGST